MQLNATEYAMLVSNIQHLKANGFKVGVSAGMDSFIVKRYKNGVYQQIGSSYKTIDECFAFVDGLTSNA